MKTIITKKVIGLLGLIMLLTDVSAQTDSAKIKMCDKLIKPSKYIFEGKVISVKYGKTVKTGEYTYYNFNSYLVEVEKVIKGNIQKGTIEIIETAPGVTYKDGDHIEKMGKPIDKMDVIPSEALYFSKAEVNVKDSGVSNTNLKSIRIYDAIPLSNGELKKEPRGITQYFGTLQDFSSYINSNYGIKLK